LYPVRGPSGATRSRAKRAEPSPEASAGGAMVVTVVVPGDSVVVVTEVEVVGAWAVLLDDVLEEAAVTLPLDFWVSLSEVTALIPTRTMKPAVTGAAMRTHLGQLW
jgi:hypothetical protein